MHHTPSDQELAERTFGAAAHALHVAERDVVEGAPIRLVYRDPDGGWWFSSGGDDDAELSPICLACLLRDHRDLVEVADLELNWVAHRNEQDCEWEREPRPPEWGPWE